VRRGQLLSAAAAARRFYTSHHIGGNNAMALCRNIYILKYHSYQISDPFLHRHTVYRQLRYVCVWWNICMFILLHAMEMDFRLSLSLVFVASPRNSYILIQTHTHTHFIQHDVIFCCSAFTTTTRTLLFTTLSYPFSFSSVRCSRTTAHSTVERRECACEEICFLSRCPDFFSYFCRFRFL
jgi:hypothetical protein